MKLSELKTEINSIMEIDNFNPDYIVQEIVKFNNENGILFIDNIELCAAVSCGVSIKEIRSKSRKRNIVRARCFVYNYCYNNLDKTLSELGVRYNQDHSTVSSAIKSLTNDIKTGFSNTVVDYEKFNELIKNQKDEHKNTLVTIPE
jgi:chromosomal replication initiation ATPase DnaA